MNVVNAADGTLIAYERSGSGPALVLVDAAGCFRRYGPMRPLAQRLGSAFTVYTYDRRGRGESTDATSSGRYVVEREIEDLAAVIDAAGGSAAVYGFSSGAALAMHAAAAGLPISGLALLEPPIGVTEHDGAPVPVPALALEIDERVRAGQRGEAIETFHRGIGVPPEFVTGLRQDPAWPALEALAHTLVYDLVISATLSGHQIRSITTPALVVDSTGSDERLRAWARGVADALPAATYRSVPGQWHGPDVDELVATVAGFLAHSTATT